MTPTLPLLFGSDLSQRMAASESATTLSSATPPSARILAVMSSGEPCPARQ